MIFVARTDCPKSLDPNDPNSAGAKELAAAKALAAPPPGSFFKAYAGDDVRQALIDMFFGKCAYCESLAAAGNDADIEHYRPKGGVSEAEQAGIKHDGYWWLAMDWFNLVLSCAHCNQERRQLTIPPGASAEEIRKAIEKNDRRKTGKKNAFPCESNIWVTAMGPVTSEKPLLIDPTDDDPEPLFEWVPAGALSTIRGRNGNQRAEATWRVLGLNRRRLTEARGKSLIVLNIISQKVRNALEDLRDAPNEAEARQALRRALDQIDVLRTLAQKEMAYAGLARSYLKEMESLIANAV